MLKGTVRRFCALVFLMFLLVEWGSHDVAFAQSTSSNTNTVQSQETDDGDPCATMIRCSDNRRQEIPAPNFGHIAQHNAVFDRFFDTDLRFSLQQDPKIRRSKVNALFRPPSPPFLPPELS